MREVSTGGARRWVRGDRVLWRRTPGAVVLLTDHGREPFSLTGSGRALWELLGEALDEAELCRRLAALHGTEAAGIAADVHRILRDLAGRGAVRHPS
ncbi:hypothetical protein BH24ACT1_BH24ACT1_09320 [soil metagenome]|jgi:hypothetical protein